jgi:hypothetical protein
MFPNFTNITKTPTTNEKKLHHTIWFLLQTLNVNPKDLQYGFNNTNLINKQTTIQLGFHNLCLQQELPPGTKPKHLLGLNLKYCLTSNRLDEGLNNTLLKLAQYIRTRYYLKSTETGKSTVLIPQIYLKNKTRDPQPASTLIENQITHFEKALKKENELLQKKIQK